MSKTWKAVLVLFALGLIPAFLLVRAQAQRSNEALKNLARGSLSKIEGELKVAGLKQAVEILRDQWGIPHIYAQNTDDLFFAQGYVMAQDRLWQMEIWKRTRQGRLSEILGPAAVQADRNARMTMYRGPLDDAEFNSYHPEGRRIFTAYINGINAFIDQNAGNLPVEFKLTGLRPEPWTINDVILRAGGFGDATSELRLAQNVARLGLAEANRRAQPDPWDDLRIPDGLDVFLITDDVVNSLRGGGQLPKVPILDEYRNIADQAMNELAPPEWEGIKGSNNWVMSAKLSKTGRPLLANDPHREVMNPSLRYIVHLNAPGWNAIGSGEAPFVGIALGHNDRLAWGFTIVGTDQHDVYIEEINPENPNEVMFNGKWEPLRTVREELIVKGAPSQTIELKFSRHGVVFFEDRKANRAYVVRSALSEPGAAPYIGGLTLAQTQNCAEFLEKATNVWKAPTENLICADVDGNIGWQASALTPSRQGWMGRLPVPGTGKYEWNGFRRDLPRSYNPPSGWIATANNNIHPDGYYPPVMFKTPGAGTRVNRIREMIAAQTSFNIDDFKRMQQDALSTQAREDLPVFSGWTSNDADVESVRGRLAKWDAVLRKDSFEGALYQTWRNTVDRAALDRASATVARNRIVEAGIAAAMERLKQSQGAEMTQWRWGRMNIQYFSHPLLKEFDVPSVERRGGAGVVAANGATYREIFDVGNWDAAVVTNVPGQSGQPESPYFSNLLSLWSNDEYFPLVYSRKAVEEKVGHKLTLKP
jgi:penicillin G amidase